MELEINHEWHPKQKEVLEALQEDSPYDLVVFRTGYGGGKTLLGCRWIIRVALNYPRSDNLVMAVDFSKGEATTFKRFFKELPGDDTVPSEGGNPENSKIIKKYDAQKKRLTTVTNSVIRLASADKWNRYAGGEFNAIFCDEPAHYETTDLYKLHEMLVSRQRTKEGPNKTLWCSTGSGYNQFYDITEKKVNKDGEELQWSDSIKVIVGSARDNPWHEGIEKLERQFEGTEIEKQAIEGGFAAPEGLVYDFDRTKHVVPRGEVSFDESERFIYGYDHGWKDPRVILQIMRNSKGQYIVVDEFYREESKVEDAVKWLKNKPDGVIYCEHEPEHIEKFKSIGFQAEKAKKSLDEGIPFVREYLDIDEEGRVGLKVSDNCRNIIQEFLGYKEEEVGKNVARDHAMDALRYALFTHENTSESKTKISQLNSPFAVDY